MKIKEYLFFGLIILLLVMFLFSFFKVISIGFNGSLEFIVYSAIAAILAFLLFYVILSKI
jgi:hypothetical protein